MKRIGMLLMAVAMALVVRAQQVVVLSITGQVEVETADGGKRVLGLRERLQPSAVLTLGYGAQVELLDEQGRRKHVVKTAGRGRLGTLLADRQSTVMQLTEQYLAYLLKRVRGTGELTARRHSDPATVTREAVEEKDSFAEEYELFQQQAQAEYESFRQRAMQEYADFVRKAWQEFGAKPARPKPKEEVVPPVVVPDDRRLQPIKSVPLPIDEVVLRLPKPAPQPVPVAPIREQKGDSQAEYVDFTFYGTPMRVRFTAKEDFRLASCSPNGVADALVWLGSADYNNTLRDCLELRQRHELGDWAYLQLLDSLSQACMPSARNEATLLMAWLYQQSGYKMRLGVDNGHLAMLYATRHLVYGKLYYYIGGDDYYVYNGHADRMKICEASYPREQPLSLLIPQAPMLAEDMSAERTLQSKRHSDMVLKVRTNKNVIRLYNDYPTSMTGGNFVTRWAMYANTPLERGLQTTLLPALREKLKGLPEKEAAERLLNWVQTAFIYEYDDKVWGEDRAFFADETLYYPYCDCEDRSILLSRLVRDLLGLKVLLVYYPGHLATAIHFNSDVAGDYIEYDGQRYVVCDPTILYGTPVGQTMKSMDNQTAKVILLE